MTPDPLPNLAGTPVWLGAGRRDPLITVQQTEALAALLSQSGADVTMHWEPGGHQLMPPEVEAAAIWMRRTIVG